LSSRIKAETLINCHLQVVTWQLPFDLDLDGLGLFGLGQRDGKHAIPAHGIDFAFIDFGR